jgi:putative ABC transport system ATP-binding protein
MTIILVTHETDIAAYAGREVVIKDGRVQSDRQTQPVARLSPLGA